MGYLVLGLLLTCRQPILNCHNVTTLSTLALQTCLGVNTTDNEFVDLLADFLLQIQLTLC